MATRRVRRRRQAEDVVATCFQVGFSGFSRDFADGYTASLGCGRLFWRNTCLHYTCHDLSACLNDRTSRETGHTDRAAYSLMRALPSHDLCANTVPALAGRGANLDCVRGYFDDTSVRRGLRLLLAAAFLQAIRILAEHAAQRCRAACDVVFTLECACFARGGLQRGTRL